VCNAAVRIVPAAGYLYSCHTASGQHSSNSVSSIPSVSNSHPPDTVWPFTQMLQRKCEVDRHEIRHRISDISRSGADGLVQVPVPLMNTCKFHGSDGVTKVGHLMTLHASETQVNHHPGERSWVRSILVISGAPCSFGSGPDMEIRWALGRTP